MKTKRSENQIRARFYNRAWAVNLSINGEPANHYRSQAGSAFIYSPERGEERERALKRFIGTVAAAVEDSTREPILLSIYLYEKCDDLVIECLAALLHGGPRLSRTDGSRVELNPQNLIVNLWLDEDDPATAEVVERIVGKSAGGTVAGMSKMPDHKPGRKEEPRAAELHWGSRRARAQYQRGVSSEE